jgi:hypothetical protein
VRAENIDQKMLGRSSRKKSPTSFEFDRILHRISLLISRFLRHKREREREKERDGTYAARIYWDDKVSFRACSIARRKILTVIQLMRNTLHRRSRSEIYRPGARLYFYLVEFSTMPRDVIKYEERPFAELARTYHRDLFRPFCGLLWLRDAECKPGR